MRNLAAVAIENHLGPGLQWAVPYLARTVATGAGLIAMKMPNSIAAGSCTTEVIHSASLKRLLRESRTVAEAKSCVSANCGWRSNIRFENRISSAWEDPGSADSVSELAEILGFAEILSLALTLVSQFRHLTKFRHSVKFRQ